MRRIVVTIPLLLLVVVVAQSKKGQLSQSEAIALAERFIAENGYTDLPSDKTKLSYETIEWESNVDKMLEQRHDTLERRAYGFSPAAKVTQLAGRLYFATNIRAIDKLDQMDVLSR